ncbi:MAG: DUF262 domain-containing protein [Thermoanaerobaculia bacterium]
MAPETAASLPPRLARRPEARSFSVEDLLQLVAQGQIRVPRFQRGLKWEDKDRVALLDSLYRGFPVGTLLLWRKRAEAGTVKLGRWEREAPTREDALWVVDGQQRITSLADLLLADEAPPPGRAIRFDLHNRLFAYGQERQCPAPRWLPVSETLDSSRLLRWAADKHLVQDKHQFDAALEVGKRLREYQIPAYIVETEDEAVLRQIFERTNQSGKRMTQDEVFDALFIRSEGGQEPSSLRAVAQDLLGLGFGRIPENLILQAVIALEGLNPSNGAEQFRKLDEARVLETLGKTQRALSAVIRFLQEEAEVPHITLLPYGFPIAGLCRFFHFHPLPRPNSLKLLSRWLWRGATNREHAWGTQALRWMIGAIQNDDEEGSVQRLLKTVERRPEDSAGLGAFDLSKARSKVQLVALASRKPRSLQPADLLDEQPAGELLVFAAFCDQDEGPAVRLTSSAQADLPYAKEIASRILHPVAAPSQLREWLARSEDPAVLASHAVSPEARAALEAGDVEGFLAQRHALLCQLVAEFIRRKADWDAADLDRPTIGYLTLKDE